jgi:hypothetical protein
LLNLSAEKHKFKFQVTISRAYSMYLRGHENGLGNLENFRADGAVAPKTAKFFFLTQNSEIKKYFFQTRVGVAGGVGQWTHERRFLLGGWDASVTGCVTQGL